MANSLTVKQAVQLSMTLNGVPPTLHMVQGDTNSRTIVATLWGGAQPYSIPAGAAIMVRFRKPDGTGGLYDATEGGNKVSYAGSIVTAPVAAQILAVAGTYLQRSIFLAAVQGQRLSGWPHSASLSRWRPACSQMRRSSPATTTTFLLPTSQARRPQQIRLRITRQPPRIARIALRYRLKVLSNTTPRKP